MSGYSEQSDWAHANPRIQKAALSSSWALIAVFCFCFVLLSVLASRQNLHWYLLPVFASGILIGKEAVDWCRGELPVLDPVALFSVFGLYFFFVAYLLHVSLGFFWHYRYPPPDWRPWLGYSAALNVLGLLVYRRFLSPLAAPPSATRWTLNRGRFLAASTLVLAATALFQRSIYARFGGMVGAAYAREQQLGSDPFAGLGWAISLAESFPAVLLILVVALTRQHRIWSSRLALPLLLTGMLVTALIFGGLRGSRSTVFVVVFWAAVLFHTHVRPVSRRLVAIGPIVLFLFMTGYLYYKHGGVEGVSQIGNPAVIQEIEDRIGFGDAYSFILLHDFARADSHALLLYLDATESEYEHALGRTLFAGALSVIPRALWPNRPEGANLEKSALLYGPGSNRTVYWSFGIGGEFLLNFGALSIPLSLVVIGALVRLTRRAAVSWPPDDSRALLWPLLLYLVFVVPLHETQVIFWALAKNGMVPALVIIACSTRTSRTSS